MKSVSRTPLLLVICSSLAATLLLATGIPPAGARPPGDLDLTLAGLLLAEGPRHPRGLGPTQREQWKRHYQRWRSLPPDQQEALRRRLERWRRLPPEQRSLLLRRFEQWQQLPPAERERLRRKLEQWESLPPRERDEIRRRFK